MPRGKTPSVRTPTRSNRTRPSRIGADGNGEIGLGGLSGVVAAMPEHGGPAVKSRRRWWLRDPRSLIGGIIPTVESLLRRRALWGVGSLGVAFSWVFWTVFIACLPGIVAIVAG
jgi:hypothetical protein